MNILMWKLRYNGKAKRMFETYDIVGLTNLASELDDTEYLDDLCIEVLGVELNVLLGYFDQQFHVKHTAANMLVSNPLFFDFLMNADPTLKSRVDANLVSLYTYLHPYAIGSNDDKFFAELILYTFSNLIYNERPIEEYIQNNELTDSFIDALFSISLFNEFAYNSSLKIPRALVKYLAKKIKVLKKAKQIEAIRVIAI